MEPQHDLEDRLTIESALLLVALEKSKATAEGRIGALDKHIHDAEAREHRRAAFNLIDRKKYLIGSALEPFDGLDLDPVKLSGFLALGQVGVALLVRLALARPGADLVTLLTELFDGPLGDDIRQHGVFVRWRWLSKLYRQETASFAESAGGRNPDAKWRVKKPTANQRHLIREILQLLQTGSLSFSTRGDAFDWLRKMEGNPRFWEAPPQIDLAKVIEWRP